MLTYTATDLVDRAGRRVGAHKVRRGAGVLHLADSLTRDETEQALEAGARLVKVHLQVGAFDPREPVLEGVGLGGLEYAMQDQLAGTTGSETYETSPNGRIPLGTQVIRPPVDGVDVELTLDPDFQWMVEQRLRQRVDEVSGLWGVAVVLDVETGELLALANYPSYDSNDPGAGKPADMGNRAITATYEPGSVQKVLIASRESCMRRLSTRRRRSSPSRRWGSSGWPATRRPTRP